MRILKLRFQNLNSLVGEWQIDFTDPAFDGLFAISGPTGAGKTTMLDALCLALYGRTPRLEKVNKTSNEIISRQTGACFAEVEFATETGTYRCHWSQRRARNKPDGELQNPKHELADARSQKVLETKLREVGKRIEDITGMDFERFTRSMLLAQGGFAAFLQAAPDERAPILEQITGSEIYSTISIKVYERHSAEKKQLESLREKLGNIQPLDAEQEQQLRDELAQQQTQEQALQQQLEQCEKALAWLQNISRLSEEIQTLRIQRKDWEAEQRAFAPQLEKLTAAERALNLAADYRDLQNLRKTQQDTEQKLQDLMQSLPAHAESLQQLENQQQSAASQLQNCKTEQEKQLPLIRAAQKLDLQIAEQQAPIETAKAESDEQQTALHDLGEQQQQCRAEQVRDQQNLEELSAELSQRAADAALPEALAGIQNRIENLQQQQRQFVEKQAQTQAAAQAQQQAEQALNAAQSELAAQQSATQTQQQALADLLAGQSLADWRKTQQQRVQQANLLEKIQLAAEQNQTAQQALQTAVERTAQLEREQQQIAQNLQQQQNQHAELEKRSDLLNQQLLLLNRIQDLEEARQHLQDGEPCPLCGAQEHPYAQKDQLPQADDTTQQLAQTKAELKQLSAALAELHKQQARLEQEQAQLAQTQQQQREQSAKAAQQLADLCPQLQPALDAQAENFAAWLAQAQADNAQVTSAVARLIEAAEGAEQALERAKAQLLAAEKAAQQATYQQQQTRQEQQRLSQECEQQQAAQAEALARLQTDLQAYGVDLSGADLSAVLADLRQRAAAWREARARQEQLQGQLAQSETRLKHLAEQQIAAAERLQKYQAQHKALVQAQQTLQEQRREQFGERDPDEEEQALQAAQAQAEQVFEQARSATEQARQQLSALQAQQQSLQQQLAETATALQSSQATFEQRLQAAEFADESAYVTACLPEAERQPLVAQAKALALKGQELELRLLEKEREQAAESEKKLSEHDPTALITQRQQLREQQQGSQQRSGAIQQRLNDNEQLKRNQQQQLIELEKQLREFALWKKLYDLIGSADGKKYRNFAQGLTFELMVAHANQQLQRMSERYLLLHDAKQPLQLNVVDQYQAGEVRSTKNLSGGESFIVSLALALGLSQMASQNVRVDSLFLDEGFGTLDEEALDTALDTLASLQQEGKLIGVISHVAALKERISTQIQVLPQSGGRSILQGPGCVALTES